MKTDRGFLLRRRALSDTRWIVDVLLQRDVMKSFVLRVSSKQRAVLEPFRLLDLSWREQGNLPYLSSIQVVKTYVLDAVASLAMYELHHNLLCLLKDDSADEGFFPTYWNLLRDLSEQRLRPQDVSLFQLQLLLWRGLMPDALNDFSASAYDVVRVDDQLGYQKTSRSSGFQGDFLRALYHDLSSLEADVSEVKRLVQVVWAGHHLPRLSRG